MPFTAASLLLAILFATAGPETTPPPPAPIWGRIEAIGAEPFNVDTIHSNLGFTVGFMGLSKVRGSFRTYSAWILYDERDPTKTSATIFIDPASIDTGFEGRDKDLKDPRFFDVAKFPRILFQTKSVERSGPNRYVVHGTLEIKGIQKPVDLPMTQSVPRGPDPAWGNIRIGGVGAVTLKRKDFDILGDKFWGEKVIGDDVDVDIDLLAIRSNHDLWGYQAKEKPSAGAEVWKAWQSSGTDAALAKWSELKTSQPNDYDFAPFGLTVVGLRLQQRGRLADAMRFYETALAAGPKDPTTLIARMAEIKAAQGDREGAIAGYKKLLEANPNSAEAMEMLRRLERK
jgi:polyisoprenoid-binding protein YceI